MIYHLLQDDEMNADEIQEIDNDNKSGIKIEMINDQDD